VSTYLQQSFAGGMNLLADDIRLQPNQYRLGFNLRNRYDVLEAVLESELDVAAPVGIKQELITFGNYIILFVAGMAYYRYYTSTGWQQIVGFQMSSTAPRFWTQEVPIALTNYVRYGIIDTTTTLLNARGGISNGAAAAFGGNTPGLVVQDNINQPQFIFLNGAELPTVRTLQTFSQWANPNQREYVPIGSSMAWVDGILYITSQDGEFLLPSVSGRPLDFVTAVDENGDKVGTATTCINSYSVGVGGITCLREMSNGSLFVAASNANFLVSKNMTENSPKIFGEYTFIRTFLFNATCLSDRVIIDSLGDTKFIDLTGVRSFNAIQQTQNEGRNSAFTATIQAAFTDIVQDAMLSAAILYDNYEFYAIRTVFGAAIAVFDTINNCWASFDTEQTNSKRIKIFAKIELSIQRLYAVTEDDKLYTLYIGPGTNTPRIRTASATSGIKPNGEIKLKELRCVINKITENVVVSAVPYTNNRLSDTVQSKVIQYIP